MKRFLTWIVVAAGLALASCSGQAGSPAPPLAPQSRPAAQDAVGGQARVVVADRNKHKGKGKAKLVIRIPRKKDRSGRFVPAYISPYTRSLTVAVDSGPVTKIDLTHLSPYCHGNTSAGRGKGPDYYLALTCVIEYSVFAGPHVFSLITYDQTGGTGNRLSANTNVPFNVVAGSNAPLFVTLGGIAAGVQILEPPQPQASFNAADGIVIYGNAPVTFQIALTDADENMIVGAGTPALTVRTPKGAPVQLASPSPYSANAWTFTSTYQPNNPTVPSSFQVVISASPVPNSGGPPILTGQKFSLYQPWVYVANYANSAVGVSDEYGNAKTPTGAQAFSHVPAPTGIAYDPHNMWPYIPSLDDDEVCVYDVEGNEITVAGTWSGMTGPSDIAYVPVGSSSLLYVVNSGIYAGLRHAHHGKHPRLGRGPRFGKGQFQGKLTGIAVYDEQGNLQPLLPGAFSALTAPESLTYDPNVSALYVTDDSANTVYEFDTAGNLLLTLSNLPDVEYGGITINPQSGLLYAVDYSDNTVIAFDENGSIQTLPQGAFPNLNNPNGITYDPYDGLLYVSNGGDNTVRVFDGLGTEQPSSGFSSNGAQPWGIAAIK